MTGGYLDAVGARLGGLGARERRRTLATLAAQLGEIADAGIDPVDALGDPASYARSLLDALRDDGTAGPARWRVLGLPAEIRGPVDAAVRSRIWDPANPDLLVPRLFGIGWRLNLGAVAVRLGLLRPDDVDGDVLARIPDRDLRRAQSVPLAIAGATVSGVALAWRGLPPTVASGFDLGGRARGQAPRWALLGTVALGAGPALWAQRRRGAPEERLVRAASACSLAVISAGATAATIGQAHHPGGRWGLLIPLALPLAAGSALAVVVAPVKAGLRLVWRTAAAADGREGSR